MGVTMSAGAFTLFLQGCKGEVGEMVDYGIYGDATGQQMVRQLADAILPATDIPSASEVGVLDYINSLVGNVYDEKARAKFTKGMTLCKTHIETVTGSALDKLDDGQIANYLEGLMGASADATQYQKMLALCRKQEDQVSAGELDNYHLHGFLHALKSMTVNGYCQSEQIGEEILQYHPVPGPYNGNLDYNGEKVYSMN